MTTRGRHAGSTTNTSAANRDPETYEEPDRLDVGRARCPHLSLGRGIHHCLGALLARIELPGGRPKFRSGIVLRGLRSLPLRCRRAEYGQRTPDAAVDEGIATDERNGIQTVTGT